MKKILAICSLGLVILLPGCCSVFTGTTEQVTINSKPVGAKVYNEHHQLQGTTPCIKQLPKGLKETYTVELDGYQYEPIHLTRKVEWWPYLVNIIFWPCLIVDYGTDAMWTYSPDKFDIELKPTDMQVTK